MHNTPVIMFMWYVIYVLVCVCLCVYVCKCNVDLCGPQLLMLLLSGGA